MEVSELLEVLGIIKSQHSFNEWYDDNRKTVKYAEFSFDTRDGDVWYVSLKDITNSHLKVKTFVNDNCTKEIILNWIGKTDIEIGTN